MQIGSSHFLRNNKRIVFLLFLAVLLLGLAVCLPVSSILSSVFSYAEPTPVFVNHAAEDVSGLTKLWSRDDIYILGDNKTLDVSMGVGCFVGDLGKALKYDQLTCFDSKTGEILWKQEEATTWGDLAVTSKGVFVTDIAHFTGANILSGYNLHTGDLLWQKSWFESNPVRMRLFDNQIQLITWKPGKDLWVYDTNGKVIKMLNNTDVFLTTPGVNYVSITGIKAMRSDTNEVLWDHIDTALTFIPLVTEDKIFYRRASSSSGSSYYALDRRTGNFLWKVPDIVDSSSLAYSPEKRRVYLLQKDGSLLAVDEDTGDTTIAARFSSPLFLSIIDGTAETYELAYDQENHILMISFGDSHQLFAFREE